MPPSTSTTNDQKGSGVISGVDNRGVEKQPAPPQDSAVSNFYDAVFEKYGLSNSNVSPENLVGLFNRINPVEQDKALENMSTWAPAEICEEIVSLVKPSLKKIETNVQPDTSGGLDVMKTPTGDLAGIAPGINQIINPGQPESPITQPAPQSQIHHQEPIKMPLADLETLDPTKLNNKERDQWQRLNTPGLTGLSRSDLRLRERLIRKMSNGNLHPVHLESQNQIHQPAQPQQLASTETNNQLNVKLADSPSLNSPIISSFDLGQQSGAERDLTDKLGGDDANSMTVKPESPVIVPEGDQEPAITKEPVGLDVVDARPSQVNELTNTSQSSWGSSEAKAKTEMPETQPATPASIQSETLPGNLIPSSSFVTRASFSPDGKEDVRYATKNDNQPVPDEDGNSEQIKDSAGQSLGMLPQDQSESLLADLAKIDLGAKSGDQQIAPKTGEEQARIVDQSGVEQIAQDPATIQQPTTSQIGTDGRLNVNAAILPKLDQTEKSASGGDEVKKENTTKPARVTLAQRLFGKRKEKGEPDTSKYAGL